MIYFLILSSIESSPVVKFSSDPGCKLNFSMIDLGITKELPSNLTFTLITSFFINIDKFNNI